MWHKDLSRKLPCGLLSLMLLYLSLISGEARGEVGTHEDGRTDAERIAGVKRLIATDMKRQERLSRTATSLNSQFDLRTNTASGMW